jgi:hypothetical protein
MGNLADWLAGVNPGIRPTAESIEPVVRRAGESPTASCEKDKRPSMSGILYFELSRRRH